MSGMKPVSGNSPKSRRWASRQTFSLRRLFAAVAVVLGLSLLGASSAFAAGSVAQNVGGLLKSYAEEVYGGLVGASSLVFLWNRRYVELATFLLAAVVVAWMVFAPELISKAAEGIGHQIFG
jgi:hypothetical protein